MIPVSVRRTHCGARKLRALELERFTIVRLPMLYAFFPAAVLGMLGYMFWRTAAAMRRDRVRNQRAVTRGKFAFTPRHRVRFLLGKAFRPVDEQAPWLDSIRSQLDR